MAGNSKGKNASTTADQRPKRRSLFGMHQLRRGRDRKWHFYGQEPDETVRLVVREYWLFLLRPALPLILSILALAIPQWLATLFPFLGSIWWFLDGVIFLFVLVLGVRFVYYDLVVWLNKIYVITNKRVVSYEGFLQPKRQVTPLEKIQQIGIEFEQPWGYLLGYGAIYLYLTGGILKIKHVKDPRKIRDAIKGVTKEFKEKTKKPPIPKPKDPVIADTLEKLAKPKELPKLENEDEQRYGPPRDPAARLGPRRTFGSFLHIPNDVTYTSDEQTVKYVQRSRWVLAAREALPFTLLLLVLLITFVWSSTNTLPGVGWRLWQYLVYFAVPALFLWIFIVWVNYVDDVYILTNKRIIDIERRYVIFAQERIEIEYKAIKDIKVKMPNVIGILFNIGNVYVETPGTNPDIIFYEVNDPFALQDKINEISSFQEKAKKIKDENEQKKTLDEWLGTVFANFENTVETMGIPDLMGQDLSTAIAIAEEYQMELVILPLPTVSKEISPGRIAFQNPPKGTLMRKGGKIVVALSDGPP
jgi:membrane protein YdbS with pleckstrin-like domain